MMSGGFHDLNVGGRGPHAAEFTARITGRTEPPDHRTGDDRPDI